MSITGKTSVFAVAGSPVTHSLSPAMHNAWYADHGLDAAYVALPVAQHTAVESFRHAFDLGLAGLNITTPFKEAAARACQSLDPAAAHLQAANVLVRAEGGWRGLNTDAPGFVAALSEAAPAWRSRVETAVVIGAGGAGRAIAYGLEQAGAPRTLLVNRNTDRGSAAGQRLGLEAWGFDRLAEAFAQADLIVNATTLGMAATPMEWPLAVAHPNAIVADAVYTPLETPLLAAARARGLTAVDGLGMLIHQGALAFEQWFGLQPDPAKARSRLQAILERRAA